MLFLNADALLIHTFNTQDKIKSLSRSESLLTARWAANLVIVSGSLGRIRVIVRRLDYEQYFL